MHVVLIDSGLIGRGAARAKDAQGTPTQSHISPSILIHQENVRGAARAKDAQGTPTQSHISPSILVHEDNVTARIPSDKTCRVIITSNVRTWQQCSGFRVQGAGVRVQGSGFRMQGLGFRN